MTKQPEERATELMAEMDALVASCERQLEEGERLLSAGGLDPEGLAAGAERLPQARQRELREAIERDMREIEDEVRHARPAERAPKSGRIGRNIRSMA